MEEPDDLARAGISPGDVRSFMPIAVKAGEGEILKLSRPYMLAGHDVIDVKGQRIDVGGKVTKLASTLGTLPKRPDNVSVHV